MSVVTGTYLEITDRLATIGRQAVEHLDGLYTAGLINRGTYYSLADTVLDSVNTQAEMYGQTAYANHAELMTGELPTKVGGELGKATTKGTLESSLNTVFEYADIELSSHLVRLAENMPIQVLYQSFGDALRNDSRVTGWTRGLEPDACQLCNWWWRDGAIWPPKHAMPVHSGCRCQQLPTYT